MPNQIPLSTATNAAGGFLVSPELGDVFLNKVQRTSGALQLASVQRISTDRMEWPVYLGRPTVGVVGQAAPKPVTGAEFGQMTATIQKLATTIRYTEEILEDARINPEVLVNADVEAAFGDFVDANMVGTHPGGTSAQANFSSIFNAALANTTQTIELGTSSDALALALSQALGMLEGNGYGNNTSTISVLAALDAKGHMRDARDTQGRPLYAEGFTDSVPSLYGLPMAFSSNLDGFPAGLMGGAGSPAKTVAVVGDFANAKAIMRRDLYTKRSTEATIGGVSMFETNQVAVLWEMRMGFQVFEPNRAFVRIVNAS